MPSNTVDIKSARYFRKYYIFVFFLTSEAALSAIFQTKRLVSIRIKATDYFLQILRSRKLREFDRQSYLTSVFNFPAWYRWKIFTDSSMNFGGAFWFCTNINHKGLQKTANEYAEERRIYKNLISKNNNVDILNSASWILQCWSYYVKINSATRHRKNSKQSGIVAISSAYSFAVLCSPLWLMFVHYVFWVRVRAHEKNSGDAVRWLGIIIQRIFCAQSGASIPLTVWKWSSESRYPGAFPAPPCQRNSSKW